MPKYYIKEGSQETIIEADSPLQACFRAVKHRFNSFPTEGFYKVSEQGFDNHDDDIVFGSNEILNSLIRIMRKKKENDDDDESGYNCDN